MSYLYIYWIYIKPGYKNSVYEMKNTCDKPNISTEEKTGKLECITIKNYWKLNATKWTEKLSEKKSVE